MRLSREWSERINIVRSPSGMAMSSAEERLKKLEHLYLNGVADSRGLALSVETLLDVFLILYDECSSSTLRREKNIADFVDFGKQYTVYIMSWYFRVALCFCALSCLQVWLTIELGTIQRLGKLSLKGLWLRTIVVLMLSCLIVNTYTDRDTGEN